MNDFSSLKDMLENGTVREVLATIDDASVTTMTFRDADNPQVVLAAAVTTNHIDDTMVNNAAIAYSNGEEYRLPIKLDTNDKIISADPSELKKKMKAETLQEIDDALVDHDTSLGVQLLPKQPNITPEVLRSGTHATAAGTPGLHSLGPQFDISKLDELIRQESLEAQSSKKAKAEAGQSVASRTRSATKPRGSTTEKKNPSHTGEALDSKSGKFLRPKGTASQLKRTAGSMESIAKKARIWDRDGGEGSRLRPKQPPRGGRD